MDQVQSEAAQDSYLQAVGAAVLALRQKRGLTQRELAQRVGISRSCLVGIEAGENTSLRTLARLCFALGVGPQRLGLPGGGTDEQGAFAPD